MSIVEGVFNINVIGCEGVVLKFDYKVIIFDLFFCFDFKINILDKIFLIFKKLILKVCVFFFVFKC